MQVKQPQGTLDQFVSAKHIEGLRLHCCNSAQFAERLHTARVLCCHEAAKIGTAQGPRCLELGVRATPERYTNNQNKYELFDGP
eukprot:6171973-Pleurochrysis_carterae.AAC.3